MKFFEQIYFNLELMAVVAILMILLQRLTPYNSSQKVWLKSETQLNLQYLIFSFVSAPVFIVLYEFILNLFGSSFSNITSEAAYLTQLNVVLKPFMALVLIDFIGYWQHRLFHKLSFLWKCHAAHHSTIEMDWMASNRVHVVEIVFFTLAQYLIVHVAFGFSLQTIAICLFLRGNYAYIVHANLNWTFGKFGYVFVSPVFHRWHHTRESQYYDKNYSGIFSAWDYMFGTAIMPKKKEILLGINENIGQNLVTQMLYPLNSFRR